MRRSIREGTLANCTIDDVNDALMYFVNENNKPICPYSGTELTINNLHLEHIIPISLGGGTVAENLIPSCSAVNSSKNGNHMIEWYEKQPFFTVERFQKIVDYIIFALNKKTQLSRQNIDVDDLDDFDPVIQTSGDVWETQEETSVRYLEQQNNKLKFGEFLLQCIMKLEDEGIIHNKNGDNYLEVYYKLMEKGLIDLNDSEVSIQQSIFGKIKNIVKNKYSTCINIDYKLVEKNIDFENADINAYIDTRFCYLKQILNIDDRKLGILIESVPQFISYSDNEIDIIFSVLKDKKINNSYIFIINNKSLFNSDIKDLEDKINKNCEMLGMNHNDYLNGLIPESAISELNSYFNSKSIDFFSNKAYKSRLVNVVKGNSSIRNKLIQSDTLFDIVENLIVSNNYDYFKSGLRSLFDSLVTDLEFEYKYCKIINHPDFKKYLFLERFKKAEKSNYYKQEFELQKNKVLKFNNLKDFNTKEYNYKSQIQTIFSSNSAFGTSGKINYRFIKLSYFNDIVEDLIRGEKLNSDSIKHKMKNLFLQNGYTEEMFEIKYNQYLTHEKINYLIELEKIKRKKIKDIYMSQLIDSMKKINSADDVKKLIGNEFAFKNKLQLQFSRNTNIKNRRINPCSFNSLIEDLKEGLEFGSGEFKNKLYKIFENNGFSYEEFLDKYSNIISNYGIIINIELMKAKENRIKILYEELLKNEIIKVNEANKMEELSRKNFWYLEKLRSIFVSNSNINGEKLGSSNFTQLIELLISGKKFEDEDIKEIFFNIFFKICNGKQELITQKYNQYLNNDEIKIYLVLEKVKRERIKQINNMEFNYYKNKILTATKKKEIVENTLYFKSEIQTIFSNNSRIHNKKNINLSEFKDVSEKLILGYDIHSEEIRNELLSIFLKNGRTQNEFEAKYKNIYEHPKLYIYIELEKLKRQKMEEIKNSLGGIKI